MDSGLTSSIPFPAEINREGKGSEVKSGFLAFQWAIVRIFLVWGLENIRATVSDSYEGLFSTVTSRCPLDNTDTSSFRTAWTPREVETPHEGSESVMTRWVSGCRHRRPVDECCSRFRGGFTSFWKVAERVVWGKCCNVKIPINNTFIWEMSQISSLSSSNVTH